MVNKKAQQTMGLPFGIIFAIFLIVVFVVIAFIAVRGFLDIGGTAEIGLFYDELQDVVDNALSEQSSEFKFNIDLPKDIEKICFGNLSEDVDSEYEDLQYYYEIYNANLFLIPPENAKGMEWKLIKHINITEITKNNNPYCVDAGGKLLIKKGFYDKLVLIS